MRKTIVVAIREYHAAVRSKAFVVTLVAMPILMVGSIAAQVLLEDKVDISDRKLAVVDNTGRIYDVLAAAALARNESGIFATEEGRSVQNQPKFVLEKAEPNADDWDQFLFDLSERVRSGDLFAFAVIPETAIEPGGERPATAGGAAAIEYYSNSPTYRDLSQWLSATVNAEVLRLRFESEGLDPVVVAKGLAAASDRPFGLGIQRCDGRNRQSRKDEPRCGNRCADRHDDVDADGRDGRR